MALQIRQITSTVLAPDDSPVVGGKVSAILCDWDTIDQFTVAPGPISTTTDENGSFSIGLWANENGSALGYKLTIREPEPSCNTKVFKVSVPSGTGDLDLNLLNASSSVTGNESAIASLQNYIDAELVWGGIAGDINNQTDLLAAIAGGGDPTQFFQTLLLFSELDTQAKRTAARENLELNFIDGGSF